MTTNSPNPVDGDVQALIADCQQEIKHLEGRIAYCNKYGVGLSDYESQLKRQQVALAALTAEPVYQLIDDSRWYDAPKYLFDEAKACGDECRIVYTTPPAHILRPVELPCGFSPAIGDIFDRQAPVMRRDKEDGEWLHKVTVAELLCSLGHEVKS